MANIVNQNITLLKGQQATLFEAQSSQLPGIFTAAMNANVLATGDIIDVQLQTKFIDTSPFVDAEGKSFDKSDKIFRVAPLEEEFAYKILLTLRSSSTSNSVSLPYVIQRSPVI